MLVICKVGECKYHSSNGFCTNEFLTINMQGQCGRIYDRNGNIRQNWNDEVRPPKQEERIKEITDEEND